MEETYGLQDYSDGSKTFSRDPVCGANVEEDRAVAHTSYAGEEYYFCSKDCQTAFEENPAFYIGQIGASLPEADPREGKRSNVREFPRTR